MSCSILFIHFFCSPRRRTHLLRWSLLKAFRNSFSPFNEAKIKSSRRSSSIINAFEWLCAHLQEQNEHSAKIVHSLHTEKSTTVKKPSLAVFIIIMEIVVLLHTLERRKKQHVVDPNYLLETIPLRSINSFQFFCSFFLLSTDKNQSCWIDRGLLARFNFDMTEKARDIFEWNCQNINK